MTSICLKSKPCNYTNGGYMWVRVPDLPDYFTQAVYLTKMAVTHGYKNDGKDWTVFELVSEGEVKVKISDGFSWNFYTTEDEARKVADNWLYLDTHKAVIALARAQTKANRLLTLTRDAGIDIELMTCETEKPLQFTPKVAPYRWDISEQDRIRARAWGVSLD